MKQILLAPDTPLEIEPALHPPLPYPDRDRCAFWLRLAHITPARSGLIVLAGYRILLPPTHVEPFEKLVLDFGAGLSEISADGLTILVQFAPLTEAGRGAFVELFRADLPRFDPAVPIRSAAIDLAPVQGEIGRISVACLPGPQAISGSDWLALYGMLKAGKATVAARARRRDRLETAPAAPRPAARLLFLHLDIAGNGGAAVASMLERNYGGDAAILAGQEPIGQGRLLELLAQRPTLRAVSSDALEPQESAAIGHIIPARLLLIRHPLDRLAALYDHYRQRHTLDSPLAQFAAAAALPYFLEFLIRFHPAQINNPQTRRLARAGALPRPPTRAEAAAARSFVEQADILATHDRLEAAFAAAEYFLQEDEPGLDLAGSWDEAAMPLDQRLEAMRRDCGGELLARVEQLNRADLELWQVAAGELERRCRLVPELANRVAAYRARCRALSDSAASALSDRVAEGDRSVAFGRVAPELAS
jgi:hypothetical protein